MECISCDSSGFEFIDEYSAFLRVTSDCRPFASSGSLVICKNCGLIQKPQTEGYLAELTTIYKDYSPYAQAAGSEQKVFNSSSVKPLLSRSSSLIKWLKLQIQFPEVSTIIDYGCGLGNFLSEFSADFPCWNFIGIDSSTFEKAQARCPNFYFASSLDQINLADCSFFSLIHCFEHLTNPREFLVNISLSLSHGSIVYIQLPDVLNSTYDILIADHIAHYSADAIRCMIAKIPLLEILSIESPVSKELSILLRVNKSHPITNDDPDLINPSMFLSSAELVDNRILHFRLLKELASKYFTSDADQIYIFGSSIAATWLASEIGVHHISSFIDEDSERQGLFHLGLPIISPVTVPPSSIIFLPLPNSISETIVRRYCWIPLHKNYLYARSSV